MDVHRKLSSWTRPLPALLKRCAAAYRLPVQKADNDVLSGIRITAGMLKEKKIVLCSNCKDCLREMELYCWDDRRGKEAPRKEHDHAMDEMRYFAVYLSKQAQSDAFFAAAVARPIR